MKVGKAIDILPLPIIMCATLIMNGGFFDDSVAFVGALISFFLFIMMIRRETFYARDRRIVFLIPSILICVAILVSFWSIDYMENFMGVMRLGVVCLWIVLVRCRGKEEIITTKKMIPMLGCSTVLISLLTFFVSKLKPYFWENSRMSGFFQYANTNALFLTIGILILIYHWKEQKRIGYSLVQIILLFVGLLLTGSRSILLLLLVWGCWYAIRTVEFRKPLFIGIGVFAVLGGAFVAITGNTENIGRIFTVFKSNSTLWGRLLYDRDAILLLSRKFWGLGRMGYYYSQGTFQSGIYHIKFVHNDFLQIALDYGVVALILLLLFLGWQVFRGKQSRIDKELLLFVCAASLVDFHCQYIFILMIVCLLLDYGECIREKQAQLKENYILFPLLLFVFLYVGIATGCSRMGNPDMALSMLPNYTSAQEKEILSCMGTSKSYELATRLLEKNPYNITAYIARGSFYASQFYIPECIEDLDRMLELDPYNVEYYKQYETLLQNINLHIEKYFESADNQRIEEADIELLQERISSLPEQLRQMQERTSSLAYKIKDKPVYYYK